MASIEQGDIGGRVELGWLGSMAWPAVLCLGAALILFAGLYLASAMPAWAAAVAFLVVGGVIVFLAGHRDSLREIEAPRGAAAVPYAAAPQGRLVSAQILTAVAAALPDPLLVLDGEGTIILANAHARQALEIDAFGRHVTAVIRAPAVLEGIAKVMDSGEAVRVEYERHVPVETRHEALIAAIPAGTPRARTGAGTPAVLLLLRDMSRQLQVERMRADFVADASHELRTPLASVLGFIETLQGAARNDGKAREQFLELMRSQAERMKRLIEDLLSLSRIELDVHQRPAGRVDLDRAIRHVADALEPLAREHDVAVEVLLPAGSMAVQGDWDELVQVMQNLIENAIKYAASGKRVVVEGAAAPPGQAEVAVRDFGPGIPPEHLPRLTERFYRVDVQASRAKGGTGLGLAIVKHILKRHRGKLCMKSELGKGSEFTVRLPLAGDREQG